MSHHHHSHKKEEEARKYDYVYYLVALVCGMFVGAIVDRGLIYIPVGGVLGLLTAAFFVNVLVKGRENV
ncbi:hypothetical protein EOD41_13020 [Mucilaginibacter limnophilus]|uniref:Uncharacterized protein n=1 Tax=Mucilaginibacter limnophilus TaxID=1932778 RepID=A0A3S2Y2I1_9SPHI|nr:hypothetical protein [Mucilaginibacter limnophilus]RVU00395.1 hypothetical protein EOD41_13020 [Mucilaginibacter limnophilus]